MKALLIPLAACAALAGCATYGDPYGYSYPGYSHPGAAYPAATVYQGYPATYGSTVYGTYPQSRVYTDQYGRTYRDRDRDGIPNRVDADRDGDGVPNQYDAYPRDPRRR
jgi:hypothetical protein